MAYWTGRVTYSGWDHPGNAGSTMRPEVDPLSDKEIQKKIPQLAIPVEHLISDGTKDRKTTTTQDLPHDYTLLDLNDNLLIHILSHLTPEQLAKTAITCRTMYHLCKNPVVLHGSLKHLFPNVVLLSQCSLTPYQQFRVYLGAYCGEVKIVKELRNPHLIKLGELIGSSGSNSTLEAAWQEYKSSAESLGLEPIPYVHGFMTNFPYGTPRNISHLHHIYFKLWCELWRLVGDHYDGKEESIDPNSELGKNNIKLQKIAGKYNDNEKFIKLIRSLEAQNNNS